MELAYEETQTYSRSCSADQGESRQGLRQVTTSEFWFGFFIGAFCVVATLVVLIIANVV